MGQARGCTGECLVHGLSSSAVLGRVDKNWSETVRAGGWNNLGWIYSAAALAFLVGLESQYDDCFHRHRLHHPLLPRLVHSLPQGSHMRFFYHGNSGHGHV